MRFCPSCDRHVFDGTIACPFCQAPCGAVRGGSLATLGITLGVAFTACVESKPGGTADVDTTASSSPSTEVTGGTADLTTTASSSPSSDGTDSTSSTTTDDSLDAWGGTYTVSGDSSWTASPNETSAGTDTDTTGTDTGTDTGTSTTTGTDTGTSTTTTTDTGTSTTTATDTGSTDTASSTG